MRSDTVVENVGRLWAMMQNHFGNIHLDNFFPAIRQVTLAAAMLSLAAPAAAVINTGTELWGQVLQYNIHMNSFSVRCDCASLGPDISGAANVRVIGPCGVSASQLS